MKKLLLAVALFSAALVANATTKTWDFSQSADVNTSAATLANMTVGTVTAGTVTAFDAAKAADLKTYGTVTLSEWPEVTFSYNCSTSGVKAGIIAFNNSKYLTLNGKGVTTTITGLTVGDVLYVLVASKSATTVPVFSVTGATADASNPAIPVKPSTSTVFVQLKYTVTATTVAIAETTAGGYIQKISSNVPLAGIKDAISSDILKKAGDALVNPTALSVEVYTVTGVKALTSNKTSINVSELPAGVYVAKTAKGTLKFIK